MTYSVTCAECEIQREIDELDDVYDLQEEHRAKYGRHHILEFQLVRMTALLGRTKA